MSDVKVPGYLDVGRYENMDGRVGHSIWQAVAIRNFWPHSSTGTLFEVIGGGVVFESPIAFPEFARRLAEALQANCSETPKGSRLSPEVRKRLFGTTYEQMEDMDEYRLCRIFVEGTDLGGTGHEADESYADELRDKVVKVLRDRIQRSYDQGREAGRKEGFEKRFRPAPSREEIAGMDAYELCAELLNRIHGEHFDGDNGHRLLAIRDRILELAGPRKVKVTVRNYGNCWMGAISDEMFTSTFDLPEQVKESVSRCFAPLGLVPEFVE